MKGRIEKKFLDRVHAGSRLARIIQKLQLEEEPVIIGLARGGIVVAHAMREILKKPVYAMVVKKITAPGNNELAIGAVGPDKTVFWDEEGISQLKLSERSKVKQYTQALQHQETLEKEIGVVLPIVKNKTVIIVDDGVATGATAIAAALFLRKQHAAKIILATPVMAADSFESVSEYVDLTSFLFKARGFRAVGQFYAQFPQVSTYQVKQMLSQ